MEFLILIVLVAILVVLVRGQLVRADRGSDRTLVPAARQPSRAELVSSREHELGIRPCSRPGCEECRLYVARVEPGRKLWAPHQSGPHAIDGTIATVERVRRYGVTVPLYYLDPLVAGDEAWVVEASHVVLANELARYRVGLRVRIHFHGPRLSRSTGNDYFLYEVRQLP